jgi:hypothetical protein
MMYNLLDKLTKQSRTSRKKYFLIVQFFRLFLPLQILWQYHIPHNIHIQFSDDNYQNYKLLLMAIGITNPADMICFLFFRVRQWVLWQLVP